MSIYTLGSLSPKIDEGCFIAPSADVIGDVIMKKNSSLWFQVVARGDINSITIGENSNIQDLSMLHVDADSPLVIGNNVTVGHKVTLHGCTIGDGCLIGMDAVILDGAIIGKNSLVAAGTLVPPGKEYPEGSFIIGAPAKLRRALTQEEIQKYSNHYKKYIKNKELYLTDKAFLK